jgi:hypothetical protein
VKIGENITEIDQWIYIKQENGKDQADRELKIIGRRINVRWTQSVQTALGKCHLGSGRPFYFSLALSLSHSRKMPWLCLYQDTCLIPVKLYTIYQHPITRRYIPAKVVQYRNPASY